MAVNNSRSIWSARDLSPLLIGRVASLPEVATGFHPEWTGRENIFLPGASGLDALRARSAIQGMHRAEIKKSLLRLWPFKF